MKAQLSSKNTRLDVYVEDKDGNVADIEMQTTDTKSVINYDERDERTIIRELPLRTRYYQNIIGPEHHRHQHAAQGHALSRTEKGLRDFYLYL